MPFCRIKSLSIWIRIFVLAMLLWFEVPVIHAVDALLGKEASRPNVLLVVADDLGLQLSCYGDKFIQTPNIDALAASGVLFKTAYITQSSCSPSRASIFTGLYPHTHGHIGLAKAKNPPLKEEYRSQTIPALLKSAGYRTGIIGKLHVNPEESFPFDLRKIVIEEMRDVRWVANEASGFMAEDGPFFLMVNYTDPHHQFIPQVEGLPEKPGQMGSVPAWPFQQVESEEVLTAAANYYNCVRRLDTGIGLLLEKLKAAGKDQDTLVIFLGDNGPPFARGKTTCNEAGLREPFIVRWPGVDKVGLVSDAFVSSVDILPTILDAVGLPMPAHLQGHSLRRVLAGDNAGWRTTLAGEFHQHFEEPFFPARTLRDSRYKITHNLLAGKLTRQVAIDSDTAPKVAQMQAYKGTPAQEAMARQANPPEWELYDLQNDPWEFRNLAKDPAHADTLKKMQGLLLQWRQETRDPYLDPAVLAEKDAEVNRSSSIKTEG